MRRRWWVIGAIAVAAAAVGVTTATHGPAATAADDSTGTSAPKETAKVTRRDLVDETKLAGTLGYGEPTTVGSSGGGGGGGGGGGSGTITALPPLGTVLQQGDSLWQVDDHAGPALLYGSLPLWRSLRSGIADGADVAQLEQDLTDLGFGTDLTIDEHFDSHTASAIKVWQDSRGLKKTGIVGPGDVVIEPGPIRVAEQKARVGDQPGAEILGVTPSEQVVTMDVALDKVSLLSVGAAVQIQLPDETRVAGIVAAIGRVATVKQQGAAATIAVSVSLQAPVASLDAAPVNVVVTTSKATGVLVVPIRALVALAEGGYAVERVSGATTELLAVEPGAFGDGIVAVSSPDGKPALAEGDTVVVAP